MADKTCAAKITLSKPIKFADEEITVLELPMPKAKHMRHVQSDSVSPIAMILDVAAACAELPPSVIDELEAVDTMAVVEQFGPFVIGGLETGQTN